MKKNLSYYDITTAVIHNYSSTSPKFKSKEESIFADRNDLLMLFDNYYADIISDDLSVQQLAAYHSPLHEYLFPDVWRTMSNVALSLLADLVKEGSLPIWFISQ
ncbi:MAG: hypothetical protein ACH344_06020 [Yersinia sp. (in: enterobacteria)]